MGDQSVVEQYTVMGTSGGQGGMEEPSLEFEAEGLVPPVTLAPPIVHSQHANNVNAAASAAVTKQLNSVRSRRQKYRTNRPISARQQATKRNEPPGLSVSGSLAENVGPINQSNLEQTPTVQRLTKKKFRHQSSYEEAPEPEAELQSDLINANAAQNEAKPLKTEPRTTMAGQITEPSQANEQKDVSQSQRTTKPRKWLPEEDEMLRKAVQEHGAKHWKNIAQLVPGRSHVQCLQRWNKVLKPGLRKGPWTEEEDGILTSLVEGNDQVNWTDVSAQIFGRSAKQCRERWYFNLDPRIKKGEWTEEEDNTLINAQLKHGNRWAHISTLLPGRTENAVKTRFKSIMRAKKREWSAEEDDQLLQLQRSLGSKWEEIAKKMPNRTKNAVKTRFKTLTEQGPESGTATPEPNISPTLKQEPIEHEGFQPGFTPSPAEVGSSQYINQLELGRKFELDRCQSAVVPDNYVARDLTERKVFQKYYTAQPEVHHGDDLVEPPLQPETGSLQFQQDISPGVVMANSNLRGRNGGNHTVDNILDDLANMDVRLVDSIGEDELHTVPGQVYGTIKGKEEHFSPPENRPDFPRPNLRSLSGLSSLLFTSDNSLAESDCGSTSTATNAIFGVTNNLADHEELRIPDIDQSGHQESRSPEQAYAGSDYRPRRVFNRRRAGDNQKCRLS